MKAAVVKEIGKVVVEDVPVPSIEDGGVLLKVEAAAICGTDVRIFNYGHAKVRFPWILGHEMAGTIADMKTREDIGVKVGDRVNVDCTHGCEKCEFCQTGRPSLCRETKALGYFYPGAFAEYIAIPPAIVRRGAIRKLADNTGFIEGSIIEPLAAAINGHDKINVGFGETVAIIGAGPLGYMHSVLSRLSGAALVMIFDRVDARLEYASDFGVSVAVNSSSEDPVRVVKERTGGEGAEVVIVACSATEAANQAIEMARRTGRVLLFAGFPKDRGSFELNANLIHYNEVGLFGCFGATQASYETAYRLVNSGVFPAGKFVTNVFPLDRIAEGLNMVKAGEGLKVVIQP